eukprot:m.93883 g.93883  ORF g.93883 m.93883 type:complete len:276 (-) comp20329_c0_seq3:240-1067(-)
MSEVVAMDEGGGGGDSESPMLSRPETTTSEKAAEEHSAEVMADVVSATENQLQDAEDQSTDMMARVLSATDKQVDVEEVSRPGTSTSEQDAEEQSKAVMTRVLSATNMRISRLMSAGSRPSTRGGVVSAGSRPSTRGGKPSSTAGDGAHSAVWEQVETIVSDTCVSWQLSEGWKFCVKQVGQLESKYLIEAIFSIPTRRRPVPTATASVLFAVDMNGFYEDVHAEADEILFSIETQDLIHNAAQGRFSEQWLYDVLAAKRLTHTIASDILGPGPM